MKMLTHDTLLPSYNMPSRLILSALLSVVLAFFAPISHGSDDLSGVDSGDLLDGDLLDDDSDDLLDDDLLGDDSDDLLDDDLLGGDSDDPLDDDLLDDESLADETPALDTSADDNEIDEAARDHLALFAENRYPSANTCKVCHPKHYDEWSVSQHAYAQLSPVYMAMQNTINKVTSSTNGDFCIRCHTQVGMNIGESTFASNLERHPTSREGITCVVCHRVNKAYGKVSGRIALEEGSLLSPVYGPTGNKELSRVLDNTDQYRVVTNAEESGRKIHADVGHFPQLSNSSFCGSCHDVNLFNGFRLEEAFSEYKNSPAAKRKESCQDCHMGTIQGKVSDYDHGPAAIIGGKPTQDRKLTNHFFAGPDYSIIHPGIFPHNADAAEMATLREWLEFDHKAGWGTDEFEDDLSDDYSFPQRWDSVDDRYDAREVLERQFERLQWAEDKRLEVLRNGYLLGEINTLKANRKQGLEFTVTIKNGTDGHNVPTGFDAERLIWLAITITDPNGEVVFRSGDLDPNGDVRDTHSLYVHNDELPLDKQLFTLQSRFVTTNVRGGEREQVLAVNYSLDPLPFIRPFTRSLMMTGQPGGARKHRQTIPPLAKRVAHYKLKAKQLSLSGTYKTSIQLKSAMVPVNLIDAIKGVGFDYNMSAKQVANEIVANHQIIWEKSQTFDIQ